MWHPACSSSVRKIHGKEDKNTVGYCDSTHPYTPQSDLCICYREGERERQADKETERESKEEVTEF